MSGPQVWRVVVMWSELVDGRSLDYAEQADHSTSEEGFAAFHEAKAHPRGANYQVDLMDLSTSRRLESWRASEDREGERLVGPEKIRALNEKLAP